MKLSAIASHLGCTIPTHAADIEIDTISSLELAGERSITFISSAKFLEMACHSRAAAIMVKKGTTIEGKVVLPLDDPYLGYAKVARLFEETSPVFGEGVHPTAAIDPTAMVHPTVHIGPYSVIGPACSIGERTVIAAHCTIERGASVGASCRIDSGAVIRRGCVVGSRVIVQSNAVIGSEGFGNAVEKGQFVRIPCFGTVIIEDDVEIGANTTIDRGNFQPTLIKKGTRIDNLVQIAHNVEVGEHTAIAAQAGISGSTKIGSHVLVAGQAGFVGHIEIGDGATIGAKAGVSKSVEPGQIVTGYPARNMIKVRRIEAAMQDLPQMHKEFQKLKKRVEELSQKQA